MNGHKHTTGMVVGETATTQHDHNMPRYSVYSRQHGGPDYSQTMPGKGPCPCGGDIPDSPAVALSNPWCPWGDHSPSKPLWGGMGSTTTACSLLQRPDPSHKHRGRKKMQLGGEKKKRKRGRERKGQRRKKSERERD